MNQKIRKFLYINVIFLTLFISISSAQTQNNEFLNFTCDGIYSCKANSYLFNLNLNETKTFRFNVLSEMVNESYELINIDGMVTEPKYLSIINLDDIERELFYPDGSRVNLSNKSIDFRAGSWKFNITAKGASVTGIPLAIIVTLSHYSLESFPVPYIYKDNKTLNLLVVNGDNESEEVIAESQVFIESLYSMAPKDTSAINRTPKSLNSTEKMTNNLIIIGTVENNTWSNPLMKEIWQKHSTDFSVTFVEESGTIKIYDNRPEGTYETYENNLSERTHYALISTLRSNNRYIMLVGGLDANATVAVLKAMTNETLKKKTFGNGSGNGVVINWIDSNSNNLIEIQEIKTLLAATFSNFALFVGGLGPTPPSVGGGPPQPSIPSSSDTSPKSTSDTSPKSTSDTSPKSISESLGGAKGAIIYGKSYPNAYSEETGYIFNLKKGDSVTYTFKKMETDLVSISFKALFTPNKNVMVLIQELNTTPQDIIAPQDKVYKYLNLRIGLKANEVDNVKYEFRVSKNFIRENNIEETTLKLNRYNESKWVLLKTNKTRSDANYTYYEAMSKGFDLFAITGKPKIMAEETPTQPTPTPAVPPKEEITPISTPQTATSEVTRAISGINPIILLILIIFAKKYLKRRK